MFGHIKLDKADVIYSKYLRTLRGKCEICGKTDRLEISHFYGRRAESVRYDQENTDVLCNYHHRLFHERPADYTEWKKKQLGEKRFKLLTYRANQYKKKDRQMVYLVYKKLYDELNTSTATNN